MFDLRELTEAKKRKRNTGDSEESYSMAGSTLGLKQNKTVFNFGSPSPGKMTKASSESGFGKSPNFAMKKAFTVMPFAKFTQDKAEERSERPRSAAASARS